MLTEIKDYEGRIFKAHLPTECPFCNRLLTPEIVGRTFRYRDLSTSIPKFFDLVLSCSECEDSFFATYEVIDFNTTFLKAVYPPPRPQIELPKILLEKFPDFHEAYYQAAVAETHGLNPLCGMGYRRALEILIKQHLIGLHPDEQDTILKESLAKSYERLDDKERALARGAAWLGNDYAHMVNKHPDYDIDDLKSFIHALSYLISAYLTAEEANNVSRA